MVRGDNGEECERCIKFRISDDEIIDGKGVQRPAVENTEPEPQHMNSLPVGDKDFLTEVSVSPNPSEKGWEVSLRTVEEGTAEINLYDINGRKITQYKKKLLPGVNSFMQSADDLPAGIYILTIKKNEFFYY